MATRLVRLRNDKPSIDEAAKTLSLAFSNDPLIRWLRPDVPPWSDLDEPSLKWQRRRIQRFNCEHAIFQLQPAHIAKDKALSNRQKIDSIAMIELPKSCRRASVTNLALRSKMFLCEIFDPCSDSGSSEQRVEMMMDAHNKALDEIRATVQAPEIIYIEVIAIHPSQQGRGLGGKLMNAIIELAGRTPVVLECTDTANMAFYTRFGFQLVKEIALIDPARPADKVVLFLMVRT